MSIEYSEMFRLNISLITKSNLTFTDFLIVNTYINVFKTLNNRLTLQINLSRKFIKLYIDEFDSSKYSG